MTKISVCILVVMAVVLLLNDVSSKPSLSFPQSTKENVKGQPFWAWVKHGICFATGTPSIFIPSGWTHTCTRNYGMRKSYTASGLATKTQPPKTVMITYEPEGVDGHPRAIVVQTSPVGTNGKVEHSHLRNSIVLEMSGDGKISYIAIATPSENEASCYKAVEAIDSIKQFGKVTYERKCK